GACDAPRRACDAARRRNTPPEHPSSWYGACRRRLDDARRARQEHLTSKERTSMDKPSFEQLIKDDRAATESKLWRGTFLEYLDLVREDPSLPKLSHARTYDTIMRVGTHDIHDADDARVKRLYKDESLKVFHFFSDEFFGIERTVAQIVRYFHSASLKGEESRQVLYLMGPVGSGKSSLVERLQRGLEASEPVHAIEGC